MGGLRKLKLSLESQPQSSHQNFIERPFKHPGRLFLFFAFLESLVVKTNQPIHSPTSQANIKGLSLASRTEGKGLILGTQVSVCGDGSERANLPAPPGGEESLAWPLRPPQCAPSALGLSGLCHQGAPAGREQGVLHRASRGMLWPSWPQRSREDIHLQNADWGRAHHLWGRLSPRAQHPLSRQGGRV